MNFECLSCDKMHVTFTKLSSSKYESISTKKNPKKVHNQKIKLSSNGLDVLENKIQDLLSKKRGTYICTSEVIDIIKELKENKKWGIKDITKFFNQNGIPLLKGTIASYWFKYKKGIKINEETLS